MSSSAPELESRLREVVRGMGSVLVAFSGGVDSALLAWIAHQELGDRAVLLTATSATLPASEASEAAAFAEERGIRHVVVESHELDVEGYARNAGDRCYYCKSELFDHAARVARELGLEVVADGTIVDDYGDDRPGLRAAAEHQVRHPLAEAGLDKAAVRQLARELGLGQWDKPAFACLGSRFPRGTRVTRSKVEWVGRAEEALREEGLRQLRVRWHEVGDDVLARIEVDGSEIPTLAEAGVRERVVRRCREVGFRWVTVDLMGYRTEASDRVERS